MGTLPTTAAFLLTLLLTIVTAQLRVILNPSIVRALPEPDYHLWTIDVESQPQSSTTSISNLSFSLSLPASQNSTYIDGNYYKYQYRRPVSHLGERVVNQGITTATEEEDEDAAIGPISLVIEGLESGKHSVLMWHNAWDDLEGIDVAGLEVSVDGEVVAKDVQQSSRIDNIWEAATSYVEFSVADGSGNGTVEIVYTPSGNSPVYLNAFEVDTPAIENQVSFPTPANRDERLDPENGKSVVASWLPPPEADGISYDVYFGTAQDALEVLSEGVNSTKATFTDLNTMDTFYWRVDVVSPENVYTGRVFMFRLAHLAFPGAEGYGRYSRGGRGGKVVHVTSLDDSEEKGTLRHALTVETGPRTIVFDVGGVITTTDRLTVNGNYITLAGQTAPGKGIAIQGHPFGLSGASDVIFRHIRTRPGTISNQTVDGMGMQGSNYCIMDRCSMGWAIDECFSSRSAKNITFQRNMISEPLNVAGHKNYPEGTAHGYAATISGDVGSMHHNLIAHAEGRSWSMGGGVDDNAEFAGRLDIRNNVVYNFGSRVTDGGAMEVNFVGNLYKQGPASNLTYTLQATYEDDLPGSQQYHCAGNSMPGVFTQNSTQYVDDGTGQTSEIACYADISIDPPPSYQKFFPEPFFPSYIEEHTSTEAYKRVLSDSGAQQPVQDNHDKRIINETLEGDYTFTGSVSGKPGLIDSDKDAGGLEDFPETTWPAFWDEDGDGIADWWDGSTGGEGYTVLEGYLNFMAESHVFVVPGGEVGVDLTPLVMGFIGEKTFEVVSEEPGLGNVSLSGGVATYASNGEAGVDYFTVKVVDEEGSSWERKIGVGIFEGADEL